MVRFVNFEEKDFLSKKLLYKYLPLENALRTLKDKSLWFAHPSTWKDPYERRFIEASFYQNGKKKDFLWKNKIFCTCVTQTASSEAFWNMYSPNEIGVEFRLYREKLLEELNRLDENHKVFIGKVEYLKTSDIQKNLRRIPFDPPIPQDMNLNSDLFASRLFLLKRISFKYEDEIRIIIVKKGSRSEKGFPLKYSCGNTDLIQKIILDPRAGDYTTEILKDCFVNGYGFTPIVDSLGREEKRFLKSSLYMSQKPASIYLD